MRVGRERVQAGEQSEEEEKDEAGERSWGELGGSYCLMTGRLAQ